MALTNHFSLPTDVLFLCYNLQEESMNFESVMLGLEAVQISLTIMTGPNMAKQIYKEEVKHKLLPL